MCKKTLVSTLLYSYGSYGGSQGFQSGQVMFDHMTDANNMHFHSVVGLLI